MLYIFPPAFLLLYPPPDTRTDRQIRLQADAKRRQEQAFIHCTMIFVSYMDPSKELCYYFVPGLHNFFLPRAVVLCSSYFFPLHTFHAFTKWGINLFYRFLFSEVSLCNWQHTGMSRAVKRKINLGGSNFLSNANGEKSIFLLDYSFRQSCKFGTPELSYMMNFHWTFSPFQFR